MHYGGANMGQNGAKIGKHLLDFDLREKVLSFQVPDVCAKFRTNRIKNATQDTQADRKTCSQTS